MTAATLDELKLITLERKHDGAVAHIELRGGKGNILTGDMMRNLRSAFWAISGDRNIKAIVLSGEGKHFSFGASVEEHTRERAPAMIREFHGMILDIARLDVPVIAQVAGMCLGGAMELVLACNMVFADASAVFGQPEITLGVLAPPASVLLPLKIGYGRAEELLIAGENISAQVAHEIGIVNRVVENTADLAATVAFWIEKNILPKSASSLRMAVHAERLRMVDTLAEMLPRLEYLYIKELMSTHDANEGIQAFLEKRAPEWTNN
jgi:cyclohexa-1,5-dienecarbonyl-CoA hydratase